MKQDALIEKMIQLATEQLPCVLFTDEKGRYIYANKGWENNLGIKFDDVKGKSVTDIVPDSKVNQVLKTGQPIFGYVVKGAGNTPLFNNCLPLFDNGKIIGTVVVTFFSNLDDAMIFTQTIDDMALQLNYYKEELRKLRGAKHHVDEIIGSSNAIKKMKREISEASKTLSTVLIQGETGCGKELVANAIHDLSNRREAPFVKINCSAIPPELVESELFGYEGGSFTGANKNGKIGLFEAASRGSLFLDEINQMAYHVQPKLLRVLQEREVQHVGGNVAIPIDTRIIAATNVPLEDLIDNGQFREDLYYRLNVVTISIPPLREHISDVPELIDDARKKLNYDLGTHVEGFTKEVETKLMEYDWPGNVRELNNVVERAMNMQMTGVLNWDSFASYFENKQERSAKINELTLSDVKMNAEKDRIIKCLETNRFNKTKTAHDLGISRTILYQKLNKYGLK